MESFSILCIYIFQQINWQSAKKQAIMSENTNIRPQIPQKKADQVVSNDISNEQILQLYGCRKKMRELVTQVNQRQPLKKAEILLPQISAYSRQILKKEANHQDIFKMVSKRIQKMIKNGKLKKNWGKDDATILAWLLQHFVGLQCVQSPEKIQFEVWEKVASLMPGTEAIQCMFKWLSMKNNKVTQCKWSAEESKLLKDIVDDFDQREQERDWKKITRLLFLQNPDINKKYRNSKQCQQQWKCFLKPDVKKGLWTLEEDAKLLSHILKTGQKKWCEFVNIIPGRTENALKNRYTLLIDKYKFSDPEMDEHQVAVHFLKKLERKIKNIKKSEKKTKDCVQEKEPIQYSQVLNLNFAPNDHDDLLNFIGPSESRVDNEVQSLHENQRFNFDDVQLQNDYQNNFELIQDPDMESILQILQRCQKEGCESIKTPSNIKLVECKVEEFMQILKSQEKEFIPAKLNENMEILELLPEFGEEYTKYLQYKLYHQ